MKHHDLLKMLPDSFSKSPGSENEKHFLLLAQLFYDMQCQYEKMGGWRAIENAQGQTLDDFGLDYGVERGTYDDEFYRFMIRMKQIISRSDNTMNSFITVVAGILGITTEGIHVANMRDYNSQGVLEGEYLAAQLKDVPLDHLGYSVLDAAKLLYANMNRAMPAAVRLTGAFSFVVKLLNRYLQETSDGDLYNVILNGNAMTVKYDSDKDADWIAGLNEMMSVVVPSEITVTTRYADVDSYLNFTEAIQVQTMNWAVVGSIVVGTTKIDEVVSETAEVAI